MSEEKVLTLRGKRAVWAPSTGGEGSGPIDPSRLPEGYPYKEENLTTVLWNGAFYQKDVDGVYTVTSKMTMIDSEYVGSYDGPHLATGDTVVVTFDGVPYEVRYDLDGRGDMGNPAVKDVTAADTGEPFYIYAGMLYCRDAGPHTIKFEKKETTIHPMVPEFLPNGYPREGIAEITLISEPNVTFDDNMSSLQAILMPYADFVPLVSGETYLVSINGNDFEEKVATGSGHQVEIPIGTNGPGGILTIADNEIDGFYLINSYDTDIKSIVVKCIVATVTPIDPKFIPPLTSPNGTKYKLTVSDDGTLSAVAVE